MADHQDKILSIQSHVVHGYVGNTAATFPLQLLGYEVDTLNSVQFSNNTGYDSFEGQVLGAKELRILIQGLRTNNLLHYSHLLTGYVGSESFLNQIYDLLCELKQINPSIMYICDPVLGDCGKMYVPESLLPIYRDRLAPVSHVITPNQFEAEYGRQSLLPRVHNTMDSWLLSSIQINCEQDSLNALDILLARGTKYVIITSVEYESLSSDTLILFAGSYKRERLKIEFPKLNCRFTGNGDLFTALLLGWLNKGLKVACVNALHTMQAVLRRTKEHGLLLSKGKPPSLPQLELRLIQSKRDIEIPPGIHDDDGLIKVTILNS